MKVLFVGPTLSDLVRDGTLDGRPELICRPPAGQGDIARAVLDGASAIGLVDGRYEDVAAPWHKEILFAIQEGVAVFGAGSLGALRAAECAAFGMIGIGAIYERYAAGELVDDSDVAQLHGPAEVGSFPITEAFINIEATILQAASVGDLSSDEAKKLISCARGIFFKDLTLEALAARFTKNAADADALLGCFRRNRVDLKRRDALELVKLMTALPTQRIKVSRQWQLSQPATWIEFMTSTRRLREEAGL